MLSRRPKGRPCTCSACGEIFPINNGWPIDICAPCRSKNHLLQEHVVISAKARTGGILTPDLTTEQWMETLKHFHFMCAYCQKNPYECLEHFVPMTIGGSTTISNVVPSCLSCNVRKSGIHPSKVTRLPTEYIERVRNYLLQLI